MHISRKYNNCKNKTTLFKMKGIKFSSSHVNQVEFHESKTELLLTFKKVKPKVE